MKKLISLLGCVCIVTSTYAQNFKKSFEKAFSRKDTAAQYVILTKWYKHTTDDPEYYTSALNYYVAKIAAGAEDVPKLLQSGFEVINTGIAKYPNRLDMRFGKVFLLKEIGRYDDFADEIITTIKYSGNNNNNWIWTNNAEVTDPERYFQDNIHSYIVELYNMSDSQAARMGKIAEVASRYYPKNVEFLSDLSISYMLRNDLQAALKPLMKAVEYQPQDYIVLNNIAEIYARLKDKPNAVKYSELAIKYGDETVKETAKKRLEGLE